MCYRRRAVTAKIVHFFKACIETCRSILPYILLISRYGSTALEFGSIIFEALYIKRSKWADIGITPLKTISMGKYI